MRQIDQNVFVKVKRYGTIGKDLQTDIRLKINDYNDHFYSKDRVNHMIENWFFQFVDLKLCD